MWCEQLKARQILRPVGFFPRSRGLCMRLPQVSISQATIWKLEKFYTKHARNNVSKNKIHTMFMVYKMAFMQTCCEVFLGLPGLQFANQCCDEVNTIIRNITL